ncbi:G-protein subunit alpha 4 [Tieghemostelium lacteum]|uniref:G-protein subunit alpha 4 n=1 Tax=Tieghemostelium lacteum TaxID=361077 RepID=A0A151ZGI6_TIELA|nr:G-protein subunit alpha 4 [Tieghemostelium lacteum]|eukprot:KYQ93086.1 G-protein subunit alpha 4 [Tieghemostelium lacteum]
MNCYDSKTLAKEKSISKEIDSSIRKEKKIHSHDVKLLLLGASDSGKSTLFKQMKIIQENGGYSQKELKEFRELIIHHIITQMSMFLETIDRERTASKLSTVMSLNSSSSSITSTGTSASSANNTNYFEEPAYFERSLRVKHAFDLVSENGVLQSWSTIIQDIKVLWEAPEIQHQYSLVESQFSDSTLYFLDNLEYYQNNEFIPREADVLRVRIKTAGIIESQFHFRGLLFRMLDVGGQKSLRRKWIHCFENVTAVLFVASLTAYYRFLEEDETTNQLQDSLDLFQEIANSKYFNESIIVLFLNKKDIFQKRIESIPLSKYFPEYTGPNNRKSASKYIASMFLEKSPKKKIYIHQTCAVDTTNIKFVFQSITDDLIKKTLDSF